MPNSKDVDYVCLTATQSTVLGKQNRKAEWYPKGKKSQEEHGW